MKNVKLTICFLALLLLLGCSAAQTEPDIKWDDIKDSFSTDDRGDSPLPVNQTTAEPEPQPDQQQAADEPDASAEDVFVEAAQIVKHELPDVPNERTLQSAGFSAKAFAEAAVQNKAVISKRRYEASDGIVYEMYRAQSIKSSICLYHKTFAGGGTIRYYDTEKAGWMETEAVQGRYNSSLISIECDNGECLLIQTPRCFVPRENGTIEYFPQHDGMVQIQTTAEGWSVSVWCNSAPQDGFCDASVLYSPKLIFNWEGINMATVWSAYANGSVAWWCFDGYYRSVPSSYIPTGENYFYRCAASYLPSTLLDNGECCQDAPVLIVAMMDTVALNQNEYGFWETQPESTWLSSNYSIGAGFYDTRFNTDLVNLYLKIDEMFGEGLFEQTQTRYLQFYSAMAANCHWETSGGGWMIEDYWVEGDHQRTHTSLNHQVSECLLMFKLADKYQSQQAQLLAAKLLKAITDTGSSWIKENNDLYYSILPSGVFDTVSQDYPFLTYNDLFRLREYLSARDRNSMSIPILNAMLEAKQKWMDENKITGYLKKEIQS